MTDDCEMSVMVKAGKNWKGYSLKTETNVQKKLNALEVVSSCGHFTFDDLTWLYTAGRYFQSKL